MKKNKGFSLIELIVVIAIMAIVASGVIITVLSQSSWQCRKASNVIFSQLQQTRSEALAKNSGWMELCYEDGQCVIKSSFAGDEKLGKRVDISYTSPDGSGALVDLKTNGPLILTFSRGTGGFQTMKSSVSVNSSTGEVTFGEAGSGVYCKTIHITGSGSGGQGYTITMHPVTGKFECKKD